MKTFAFVMIAFCIGIALIPPRVSWLSAMDWGLALFWFYLWRRERSVR